MNTYTKTPGGWALVAPGFSPASLALSHTKIAKATVAPTRWPAAAGCRTLRFQGCGFFMTWPGRRSGARAEGVHGKDKETAAGLKSPALRLNRNAFLRRRKLILWVDFRRSERRPAA